ncbi:hypothetical protein L9F63_016212, partial [Diploptera punctata]
ETWAYKKTSGRRAGQNALSPSDLENPGEGHAESRRIINVVKGKDSLKDKLRILLSQLPQKNWSLTKKGTSMLEICQRKNGAEAIKHHKKGPLQERGRPQDNELKDVATSASSEINVHLLREKLELCNKDGAHATVVHLEIHRDMRGV